MKNSVMVRAGFETDITNQYNLPKPLLSVHLHSSFPAVEPVNGLAVKSHHEAPSDHYIPSLSPHPLRAICKSERILVQFFVLKENNPSLSPLLSNLFICKRYFLHVCQWMSWLIARTSLYAVGVKTISNPASHDLILSEASSTLGIHGIAAGISVQVLDEGEA